MSPTQRSAHRGRRRIGALLAAGLIAGAGVAATTSLSPVQAAEGDTVQILSFNDYHGHVEDDTAGTIDGSFEGPAAGGGEYLSAKLAELRDPTDSFTVAAGDLIGGSPFFSGLFHDEPSVESLNEMGLDFSGIGNHEFDEGIAELIRMQEGGCHPDDGCYFPMDPYAGAEFQWLAANVDGSATTEPGLDTAFEAAIPPYTIETADNGEKIAFIGMTLEGTAELVAEAGLEGFTFEDEVTAGDAAVAAIQAEDADVEAIVLMLHEGGLPSPFAINGCSGISGPIVEIAENMNAEIDAIITGHTHQPYTCSINDPDGDPRPVVSAWEFGKVVTELNLTFDAEGDIVREGAGAPTMENHAVIQSELTADPAITAVIEKWTPLAEAIGDTQVGTITADITRGGDPTGSDRGVESAAGNLVADAQLAATELVGAQIALMNPGGVRSDLEFAESDGEGDGVVTYGEAFTFQPFNNTLFTLPMTGAQIEAVLLEQCQPSDSSRPVLSLGVSEGFTYDLSITTEGGVCTDIEVSNLELDGTPIEPTTEYLVTVNNFLADGGDNFETFAEVDPTDRIPGPQDIDALTDYLTANSPVDPPSTDRINETLTTLPAPIEPKAPVRLLETRDDPEFSTVDGEFEAIGRLAAGDTLELQVAGRGDVSASASAVVLNIGAINPDAEGYLTVWPCDEEQPLASSVNYFAGDVVSNAVLTKLSADGMACIYSLAETDLIADLNSEVPSNGSPAPVVPARLLETRDLPGYDTIDGEFQALGRLAAGDEIELQVAGRGGVPDDADAAMLNIGAIFPDGEGFLTVYPCGEERPLASSVNYFAGDVVSNAVLAPIGEDGTVCIYTFAETDLIADVNAQVPDGAQPMPVGPARLLETRDLPGYDTIDGEFQAIGRIEADDFVELQVTGRGGVPDDAGLAILNITAIRPDAEGFLTVWACEDERPNASSVNYFADEIVPNAVVATLSDEGTVCIYTFAETDLIVDVNASASPVVPFQPAEPTPA